MIEFNYLVEDRLRMTLFMEYIKLCSKVVVLESLVFALVQRLRMSIIYQAIKCCMQCGSW